MSRELSTAKKGNPLDASRGAAVERAKAELGDALDAVLGLEIAAADDADAMSPTKVESAELHLLAGMLHVSTAQALALLERATLGELQAWTKALETPAAATEAA